MCKLHQQQAVSPVIETSYLHHLKLYAVSALPCKGPTKTVDDILAKPVYVPEDPVNVPSVNTPPTSNSPPIATLPVAPPANVKPAAPVIV